MMSTTIARRMAALAVGLASLAAYAQPAELEGVKLAPTVQVGAATLQLNGAGVRTRAVFSVYVAALYVPQKAADAAALLAQKGPRRITLTMLRTVDADTFAEALNDGLRKNHSEAQLAGWKSQIETLNANLKAAGEAKKGDVILLEFVHARHCQRPGARQRDPRRGLLRRGDAHLARRQAGRRRPEEGSARRLGPVHTTGRLAPGRPKAPGKARRATRAGRPGKRRNAAQRLGVPICRVTRVFP
jgi:hypothetical protein